jgi:hypothetical protein
MNPPKPSHQLNLEAVRRWAASLSSEDYAQCLESLSRRGREQEELALEQLEQALGQRLEQARERKVR